MKYLLLLVFASCACTFAIAQKKIKTTQEGSVKAPVKNVSNNERLYLLSTKQKTTEITKAEFNSLNKKDIDYVKVIKDPALISMYGGKGKKGVVLIVMKGNQERKKNKNRQG
ncbi:MAG TPA: hypothetical protein VJ184_14720 [Chryseolinea sp.]|nr:hypothetical protein [Chryseolinea sp.]